MIDRDLEKLVAKDRNFVQMINLRQSLDSPGGRSRVWVLVEGTVDELLYSKMISEAHAFIKTAAYKRKDGTDNGSKDTVLKFVEYFVNNGYSDYVIGIVDRDYAHFSATINPVPTNVFETDARDAEMTLWTMPSVKSSLMSICEFSENWTLCEPIVKYMGALRVACEWKGVKLRMKKWGISNVDIHDLASSKTYLFKKVEKSLRSHGVTFTNEMLDESNLHFNLDSMPMQMYVRAHDMLGLMSHVMGEQTRYSVDQLTLIMIKAMTDDEMRKMDLYKNIQHWQSVHGYNILN